MSLAWVVTISLRSSMLAKLTLREKVLKLDPRTSLGHGMASFLLRRVLKYSLLWKCIVTVCTSFTAAYMYSSVPVSATYILHETVPEHLGDSLVVPISDNHPGCCSCYFPVSKKAFSESGICSSRQYLTASKVSHASRSYHTLPLVISEYFLDVMLTRSEIPKVLATDLLRLSLK